MHWIALQPAPHDGASDAAPLADAPTALAWWALQFTPWVARVQDALVLEVSGSERLFGGRAAFLGRIFESNEPLAPVEYAQGATSLIATGRLWAAADRLVHGPEEGLAPRQLPDLPPDALPLHTLAAARAHLPTLLRLGCRTWGQLRALPRGGLARRFGAELVTALDRAYGLQPEVYPWLTVPEVFDAPLELQARVESAPALLFGARRLLAQLQVWLRARSSGVLALELLWELDARRDGAQQGQLVLRTAQPTQDMQHLQRLLGEQLARVTLPAPVLYLRLRTLQTQPLAGESYSLLPEDLKSGDSLHQMLERVAARLGPEQVLCAQTLADHRPECMQRWQPWVPASPVQSAIKRGAVHALSTGASSLNDSNSLLPTWLLPQPQRLAVHQGCPQYQGPLTLLAGPQRLEAGWLDGVAALRDYFVARSASAGLVWVYRERLGQAEASQGADWYLHGRFA
jgi:protein ImuB